jgi:hypothetical protein
MEMKVKVVKMAVEMKIELRQDRLTMTAVVYV